MHFFAHKIFQHQFLLFTLLPRGVWWVIPIQATRRCDWLTRCWDMLAEWCERLWVTRTFPLLCPKEQLDRDVSFPWLDVVSLSAYVCCSSIGTQTHAKLHLSSFSFLKSTFLLPFHALHWAETCRTEFSKKVFAFHKPYIGTMVCKSHKTCQRSHSSVGDRGLALRSMTGVAPAPGIQQQLCFPFCWVKWRAVAQGWLGEGKQWEMPGPYTGRGGWDGCWFHVPSSGDDREDKSFSPALWGEGGWWLCAALAASLLGDAGHKEVAGTGLWSPLPRLIAVRLANCERWQFQ